MQTIINYYEGSNQYNTNTTPLSFHLGTILSNFRSQYKYRPTKETLWCEVIVDNVPTARFSYDVTNDVIKAITFITLAQFEEYCIAQGITDGEYLENENRFAVTTTSTRITSFLINRFSKWSDLQNRHSEYVGYILELQKTDLHILTGNFFNGKI